MSHPDETSTPVFVSYSHRDKKWLQRLQVHLKPLVRAGDIDLWDDTRIRPGADWKAQIDRALASARVAVLLVSADFLASDFIQDQELAVLLEAAERRGTRILPVILSHSLFTDSPLGRFQAINAPDKPLEQLTKAGRDKALSDLARAIAAGLSGEAAADAPVATPTQPPTASGPAMQPKGPDEAEVQSPRGFLEKGQSAPQSLGTWIFGGLLLAFLFAVFAFAPEPLPEYKHRILALCAALLAGLFGWFLSGEIGLRIEALQSRFGDLAVRASGGLALFILVLVWWLSPLAPIESGGARQGGGADEPTIRLQALAGNIRDAKSGEPVSGVQVSLPEHGIAVRSDALGRFQMQVKGPYQGSVELMARKRGYRPREQYATLGNTSLDVELEEGEP
jgi:hypothetical protein